MLAKMLLSRISRDYSIWQKIGLFRHGDMDRFSYATGIFNGHVERAGLKNKLEGLAILEAGPGDSISTAILSRAYGATSTLVDAGRYAVDDVRPYLKLEAFLRSEGLDVPDISELNSLDELLTRCDSKYLVNGLESLKTIPDNSIDFIFSQAVLEHVRKSEFIETMRQYARIIKPKGICSHRVDLRDHLGGGRNNLRFSDALWESNFFVNSGFYTNRIQFKLMLEMFEQAGFEVEVTKVNRAAALPIKRNQLARDFSDTSDSDLLITVFDVLLRVR